MNPAVVLAAWLMLAPAVPTAPVLRPEGGSVPVFSVPAGQGEAQDPGAAAQAGGASKFNPAISVIPDMAYYTDNREGTAQDLIAGADGFGHGADAHAVGLDRGFNLREVEVAFSAAVDPYFDAWAIIAVGEHDVEAEEVYVQTRALAPGLQVRAGKFYSGIGYLNAKHPHQWDFVDAPLPYTHLLGGNVNEPGVQVTWLPALPVYVLFGGELLQGQNEALAHSLGPDANAAFRNVAGPRLFTGFVKISPTLGASHTLQLGGSFARSRIHQELSDTGSGSEAIEGPSTVAGADVVYQFDSGKQWGVGDVTVQGEYFRRRQALRALAPIRPAPLARDRTQDGFYAQTVYGFAARWRAGFRFDAAGFVNDVSTASGPLEAAAGRRYSADLTFVPTEFSLLRVQYTRADIPVHGVREKAHQVWVQLQVSLGAHGAHTF